MLRPFKSPPVGRTWSGVPRSCLRCAWLLLAFAQAVTGALTPVHLRCEYRENPLGVEAAQPEFSWVLESGQRDQRQAAYQVLVASSAEKLSAGQADLWNSGRVSSGQSTHILYEGAALSSGRRCHWKIRVWDQSGGSSPWTPPAYFEMGLLIPAEWTAKWIGAGPAHEPRPAAGFFKTTNELTGLTEKSVVDGRSTLLRTEFSLRRGIRRARAYVTGLGYYELSCNGSRVGDRVLAPAKTNYRRWVLYDTYDLTSMLQPGGNALGLMLGNGWFNPALKWWEPYRMQWFGSKRGILQLQIEYEDGSSQVVVSDGTWKTTPGPVLTSCVYDGEVYDATAEKPGWDRPGFAARAWRPATVVEPPGGEMVSHLMPPIRVTQHLRPVGVKTPRPGVFVFDLGQNFAGWARLKVSGPRGTRVTLRYAEDVKADGSLDPASNERAQATDVYVMRGEGAETYEPHFTFHGFRYVEMTGFPGAPPNDAITGCVVQTDCAATGSFHCDNELINQIHRATCWSQRSCLIGYPLDCPQRDERLGWFGDAMVTVDGCMLNFDASGFLKHWLEGVRYNQNPTNGDISIVSPRPYLAEEPDPTWSSGYLVMVWQFYMYYGDRRFLEHHFDAMSRYVDYLGTQATNHVLPRYWIGDWGSIMEGWKEGDPPSVGTAFYYYDATILAKAARVLDRQPEFERYTALAGEIKAAYRRAFYDAQRGQCDQGTQFSNAFPLVLGLVEESERAAVLQNILKDLERHQGHFTVGVLGAKYLMDALTLNDRASEAFQLVNQTGYPSWAHMLANGRTTLSEFWDLHGSHNHVMMGSVDAWFYRTLAGIQPDEAKPRFEHMIIRPFIPDTLTSVEASVATMHGRVAVTWQKQKGHLQLRVSIPANTGAAVYVPAGPTARVRCLPTRAPDRSEPGAIVYELGSGDYELRVNSAN